MQLLPGGGACECDALVFILSLAACKRHRRGVGGKPGLDLGQNTLFPRQALHLPRAQRDQDGAADQAKEQWKDHAFGHGQ